MAAPSMGKLIMVLVLVSGASSIARADEFHFENFRYGQRATGLGGAVTAVPGSPANSYYNPALLGLLQGSRFSGSMHVFGFDRRTRFDALRELLDDQELFPPRDVSTSTSIALPTATVMSARLNDRHTVALATFLVSDSKESFAGTFIDESIRARIPGADQADFVAEYNVSDSLVLTGLTYAWNEGTRWALGATLAYGHRAFSARTRRALVLRDFTVDAAEQEDHFYDLTVTSENTDDVLLLRIGTFWQAGERTALAAACSTRSVHMSGEGRLRYTLINSRILDESGQPLDPPRHATVGWDGLPTETVLPWSCRFGAAWRLGEGLSLSVDSAIHLPIAYRRLRSDTPFPRSVLNEIKAEPTANGMVGVEWRVGQNWPLRAGFFTNRSSAPNVPQRPLRMLPPQEHRYGMTGSVGFVGKDASLNIGIEYQTGRGHTVTFADLDSLATEDPRLVRIATQTSRLMVFVSGGLNFAKAFAKEELKKIRTEERESKATEASISPPPEPPETSP